MKLFVLILQTALAFATANSPSLSLPNGFAQNQHDPKTEQVSVIDADQAAKLFQDFATNKDIPFAYAPEGCYARATAMSHIADQEQITVARIYAEGTLIAKTKSRLYPLVKWEWHVAPVVYVKPASGPPALMVFDPSLFDAPVAVDTWTKQMLLENKGAKPELKALYYGDRFQYRPRGEEGTKLRYLAADQEDMKVMLALHRSIIGPNP